MSNGRKIFPNKLPDARIKQQSSQTLYESKNENSNTFIYRARVKSKNISHNFDHKLELSSNLFSLDRFTLISRHNLHVRVF